MSNRSVVALDAGVLLWLFELDVLDGNALFSAHTGSVQLTHTLIRI